MSFCKREKMLPVLGVEPGHATPLALMNDSAKAIKTALDRRVAEAPQISVHPLHNAASTVISGADLLKFMRHCGFAPQLIEAY